MKAYTGSQFILDILIVFVLAFLTIGGLSYFVASKQETPVIPLFSCYEIHGTKCTVTSNKENPCSYKVLVCKTPTGEVLYRSENYVE